MNILVLDEDPVLCASYHCDRHMVMIKEYAQILSTCHHKFGTHKPPMYKPTHTSRKCVQWVWESKANYEWLYALFKALAVEYKFRFHKDHYSFVLLGEILSTSPDLMSGEVRTAFVQDHRHVECYRENPVEGFRALYCTVKYMFCRWTEPSKKPIWFKPVSSDSQSYIH